jgi:CRISPR-associated protein Cas2
VRRRYVVSYDIASDKRRTRVFELLLAYGNHLQFSVFLADLSERELIVLRGKLLELIHEREDQVVIVDIGRETRPLESALEVLGRPYTPVSRTLVV